MRRATIPVTIGAEKLVPESHMSVFVSPKSEMSSLWRAKSNCASPGAETVGLSRSSLYSPIGPAEFRPDHDKEESTAPTDMAFMAWAGLHILGLVSSFP